MTDSTAVFNDGSAVAEVNPPRSDGEVTGFSLNFQAVPRKVSTAVPKIVNPVYHNGYLEARDFFQNTEVQDDLTVKFPSEAERDAFVRYARKMATIDGFRFRGVDCKPGSAFLRFRMETQEQYEARKAAEKEAKADLEARRARGEVKFGRKPGGSASAAPKATPATVAGNGKGKGK